MINSSTSTRSPFSMALIGECMIELQRLPSGELSQTFGGDTLNTAVYMARVGTSFGFQVEYVSAVGAEDGFSSAMLDFWRAEGVGSSLTQRLAGTLPGLYFIELDNQGERHFRYWRGESAVRGCFDSAEGAVVLQRLGDFEAIHLSGISLAVLHPEGRERLLVRLEELAGQGVSISFDFNFRPGLWASSYPLALEAARPWYTRMARLSTTALLTVEEAEVTDPSFCIGKVAEVTDPSFCIGKVAEVTDPSFCIGKAAEVTDPNTDPNASGLQAYCAALGPREVLVKNGGGSCFVYHTHGSVSVPACKLEQVVDTTAAGDSFAAAYLVGRRLGLAPEEAAQKAHSLAACVVSHRGAIIPQKVMPLLFEGVHA